MTFVMVASGNLYIFHAETVLTNCQVFTQGLALKMLFLKGRVKMPHVSKQHSHEKHQLGLKRDSFFEVEQEFTRESTPKPSHLNKI